MPLVELQSVSKSYPRRLGLGAREQTVVESVDGADLARATSAEMRLAKPTRGN